MQKQYYFIIASLFINFILPVLTIYKVPTVFHSQLCQFGQKAKGTFTFTCTTPSVQTNIKRIGIAWAQYSKPNPAFNQFAVTVPTPSGDASSFNIGVTIISPILPGQVTRIGFFLVIIKNQPTTQYIDLINFGWTSSNIGTVNSAANSIRTASKSLSITSSTIFTVATGLTIVPFTTSWYILPDFIFGLPNGGRQIQFTLTAAISGSNANVILKASAFSALSNFQGMVLLYHQTSITASNMATTLSSFSDGAGYNIATAKPLFGPNFNSKCIIGLQRSKSSCFNVFDVKYSNSPAGNYQTLQVLSPDSDWKIFCFGNGTQCGENQPPYMDELTGLCYLPTTCPLPVFTGWNVLNTCPMCTQLICNKCTVSNRSVCLDCPTPNSTLLNGVCSCSVNYLPTYTPIDKSTLGMWNGVASSLTTCLLNCTAVISGCKQFDCLNTTYCTICKTGFVLDPVSATVQNCLDCPTLITNCVQCSSKTTCTLCLTNYYITSTGSCNICSSPMPNCITCTDYQTCTLCVTGFYFNTVSHQCQCDPVYFNLNYCSACSSPTVCTACISNSYFVKSSDHLCYLCSNFDSNCLQCSAEQLCTKCQIGFTVVTVNPGMDHCQSCSSLIPHCTQCSSPTICTNCDLYYGLTSTGGCLICDQLVMPGCLQCQVASTCITCTSDTVFISGVCHFCNQIYLCLTCFANSLNLLECSSCVDGYYLAISPFNGSKQCKPCFNLVSFCLTCSATQCLSCQYPYLLGANGTCSGCQPGYQFIDGFCCNLPGCSKSLTQPDGTIICIACISALHFEYNSQLKKCVCMQGYKQKQIPNLLPRCIPICGNGIVSLQFEECDDKNNQNFDGCNQFCKIQQDFQCSQQPSKCVLILDINIFLFSYVQRVDGQNIGIIHYLVQPRHYGLAKLDWSKLMGYNFSSSAVDRSKITYSYSIVNGQLLVTVPYTEQLQDTTLQTILTLDPNYISSRIPFFKINNKLNGVNAKLIFEDQTLLAAHRNVNIMTWIITGFLLLQFYVGSYFHKMIGLQTIQVIQCVYFVRMLVSSSSTSILSSMNVIQYSAGGYQNAQLFYGSLKEMESFSFASASPAFSSINLNRFILLNVNISLAPVAICLIIYLISLAKKYYIRNKYMQKRQQQVKDQYTNMRRISQSIYDHSVFPYILMFNLICFFEAILQLSSKNQMNVQSVKQLHIHSFPVQACMLVFTTGIYCYQIFTSYGQYVKYRMTARQRERFLKSTIQRLEHDQNNLDRANYHPAYIMVYLIYYFLIAFLLLFSVLLPIFKYYLEMMMGLSFVYFLLIVIWKPYHQTINIHNIFLKFYYGTYFIFTCICYLFSKVQKLPTMVYIGLIYFVMVLLSAIMTIGFIRIYLQKKFRMALELDNDMMKYMNEQGDINEKTEKEKRKEEIKKLLSKKDILNMKNKFLFKKQLDQLADEQRDQRLQELAQQGNNQQMNKQLSPQKQKYLINKIRNYYLKKKQNLMLQNIVQTSYNHKDFNNYLKMQQPINDKLTKVNDKMSYKIKQKQKGQNKKQEKQKQQKIDQTIEKQKLNAKLQEDRSQLNKVKQRLKKQWILMGK